MRGGGSGVGIAPDGTSDVLRLWLLSTADTVAVQRIDGDAETARFLGFPTKTQSDAAETLREVEVDHAARPRLTA